MVSIFGMVVLVLGRYLIFGYLDSKGLGNLSEAHGGGVDACIG